MDITKIIKEAVNAQDDALTVKTCAEKLTKGYGVVANALTNKNYEQAAMVLKECQYYTIMLQMLNVKMNGKKDSTTVVA